MKNKILSISFIIIIFSLSIISIILPDKDISETERRYLMHFPTLNIKTIFNGDFFEEFNTYTVEQFPFREIFIKIKGLATNKLFLKKEENGVFIKDENFFEISSSINDKSIDYFLELVTKIKNNFSSENIYYSIIPDKNYYTKEEIPKINYNELVETINQNLQDITYINIFNKLSLDSYYKTDIHWKQEKIGEVVKTIALHMNNEPIDIKYNKLTYDNFYGALYGKIPNNEKPDTITYLIDENTINTKVFDYEKNQYYKVYEEQNLKNIDSYDIFLGGAKALLIMENKNSKTDKELVIFRDSFGSSLAPLLLPYYKKITLVDLRYINSDYIINNNLIDFDNNQDILFIYGIPIINNSFTLK